MTALMQTRQQRAEGCGRVAVKRLDGRTRLARLFQEGAGKIRFPETFAPGMEAVLINTAGGLTGGDRMQWGVEAGPGTDIVLTTQACEKIYGASFGTADVSTHISAAAGARVQWLPQETILFDNASLQRRLEVDLDADAEFLAVEAVILGRKAMGERMLHGHFRDRWRVRRSGRLIHAEDLHLGGDIAALSVQAAVLDGCAAFSTLLYCGPLAESMLGKARAVLGDGFGGASHWQDKLVIRLTAVDGFALRKKLMPLITVLRNGAPVPKVWKL
ncbi:urease accessory protein UreD [Rhizobiaceae bacterium n13]|uniref:Urease accessory protein UreD n=1 Tax=Ferirhizobium litorale TaxID=2927786 RepID=A0AAE3Q7S1_9HYPH|nr:urease accessory protein UreD [Fererhizobium litorale]MDI7860664.1 urease accessory protein UreD [Fererhizobium litorale]MDI7920812.1 urease accessory protein UreD [Fererhizobium litorale]